MRNNEKKIKDFFAAAFAYIDKILIASQQVEEYLLLFF